MPASTNSKNSRVQPIFGWLKENGGQDWPARLLEAASGLVHVPTCGPIRQVWFNPEKEISPTASRLAWMIRNADRLTPQDGKLWRELKRRTADKEAVAKALGLLDAGRISGIPRRLIFEGKTHADCLIECENTFIWIEGKRFDWLSPSIKWDVTRDQLSRNLEAIWSLAKEREKDYCLLICHEHALKHHEALLVDGYRKGTWTGGWPHLSEDLRSDFAKRIGTITWGTIVGMWPALGNISELEDLNLSLDSIVATSHRHTGRDATNR
jgi:hypothetical protein